MDLSSTRLVVVTGGPGSGKSTLIDALERAGHARTMEAGRGVIRDQMAIGGPALPWKDPRLFAELMLCWELRSYHMAKSQGDLVFFDRGVPDCIGYLRLLGLPVPGHMRRAAEIHRYSPLVFLAPPWPEIYRQDEERRQDFVEAVRTCEAMIAIYRDLGYELAELPRASIGERMRFVLGRTAGRCPVPCRSEP